MSADLSRTMDGILVVWQKTTKCCRRALKLKAVWWALVALLALIGLIFFARDYAHNTTGVVRPFVGLPAVHHFASDVGGRFVNRTHGLLNDISDHAPLKEHWQGAFRLKKALRDELKWNYLLEEKESPYVGDSRWLQPSAKLDQHSSSFLNALAVFAHARENHEHGDIGITPEGKPLWRSDKPLPPSYDVLSESEQSEILKERGFYEELTDALPMDRAPIDTREPICRSVSFDIASLPDASIVITFVNEPLSTLLRTVHSVLNHTPSPLVREIILVDDHSTFEDDLPGGPLYEYLKYLPKVKLMRLPERRGIVQARLAGARSAKGDVLVILDSHIEVNKGWLEPQLQRILESPKSLVFPKILGISPTTFEYRTNSGIGCQVSWRWSIVEQSTLSGDSEDVEPIPSSSLAGGLFAVGREYFMELGGYDEGFIAWGAENVELGFRIWLCGGRVECSPCSRTYHVYRKGATGYANPQGALWTNRMRTARIWMDEYFELAARLIDVSANKPNNQITKFKLRRKGAPGALGAPGGTSSVSEYNGSSFGNVQSQLDLRSRLQCKPFRWFLENVDPGHDIQKLDDLLVLGKIGSPSSGRCLDLGGKRNPGDSITTYSCQPDKPSSNQGFMISQDRRIRLMTNDKRCLAPDGRWEKIQIVQCMDPKATKWKFEKIENLNHHLIFQAAYGESAENSEGDGGGRDLKCLAFDQNQELRMQPCNSNTNLRGDKLH